MSNYIIKMLSSILDIMKFLRPIPFCIIFFVSSISQVAFGILIGSSGSNDYLQKLSELGSLMAGTGTIMAVIVAIHFGSEWVKPKALDAAIEFNIALQNYINQLFTRPAKLSLCLNQAIGHDHDIQDVLSELKRIQNDHEFYESWRHLVQSKKVFLMYYESDENV